MVVAALTVSIIALVASIASAWYARQQAKAAQATRQIEQDRRHEELTPMIIGQYVAAEQASQLPGVRLTNRGPLDLERIDIQTIPAHRREEAVVEGIHDPLTDGTLPILQTGLMRRHESWAFKVVPVRDGDGLGRGGVLGLRCTCHAAGHEPWLVTLEVEFPSPPRVAWV